jgi:precorrin-3B synthase
MLGTRLARHAACSPRLDRHGGLSQDRGRIIAGVCPVLASPRVSTDACPSALTLHQAADGGLARIRIPGGLLSGQQWRALTALAANAGDGNLHLTSRANVEIRGVSADIAAALTDAGLLPSSSHERVRNIVASPLAGIDGRGLFDVSALVPVLDAAIQADPWLGELSGRFLFGLDDGRGDIAALAADLTLYGRNRHTAAVLVAGVDIGVTVHWPDGPGLLVRAARAFLSLPDHGWRVSDHPDGIRAVASALGGSALPAQVRVSGPTPLGFVGGEAAEIALVVGAEFGTFNNEQAYAIGEISAIRITPWRSVVLPGLSVAHAVRLHRDLSHAGLAVDNSSPWRSVTACTGRPGCAKSLADVRADARRTPAPPSDIPTHWSGCERRCGHPHGEYRDVLATSTGYVMARR